MEGSPIPEARTMQAPKRWPLVNKLGMRGVVLTQDARLVNCYAEKDLNTGEYQIEKRGGLGPTALFQGSGLGQPGPGGLYTYTYVSELSTTTPFWAGQTLVIFISGDIAYVYVDNVEGTAIFQAASSKLIKTIGNRYQFLAIPNGGELTQVLIGANNLGANSAASACYVYSNGIFTTLNGGDSSGFPTRNVAGFVYLDGYCYVMDDSGTIWQTTTQNVVTGPGSWGGTAYIAAASSNDYGVYLARQLVYIVAIKSWTTQFFYDAGNTTGSSLSPLPGALYNFGCISSDTVAEIDGVLLWATQSEQGTNRIVMIENLNAKFISTPAVERQLDLNSPGVSSWTSYAYSHAGHRFYVITNFTAGVTMVYDLGEELWYLWTDHNGSVYPVFDMAVSPTNGLWAQVQSEGAVFPYDADYVYPNDSGQIVPVDIYTPNFDAGVDRVKYLSQMRFNADQTNGSTLSVRSSDNDYGSFNNFRKVDLSRKRPIINDEGSFYRRAYHFRHYANTPFRIRSVDLQMDIGTL